MQTARGRCGARPLSGRMMSGAPTGRVTASGLPARYTCSGAGRCAASEQPPHESDKNALPGPPPFPCPTTVRPGTGADKHFAPGENVAVVRPDVEPRTRWRHRWRSVLTDIRPLQVSAPYRRLFVGNAVAQLGQQMTNVAIAIQVYSLTHSSFYVGLVGVFALVPLVALGLYGGAIADAMDRRTLALVARRGLWAVSVAARGAGAAGQRVGVAALRAASRSSRRSTRSTTRPAARWCRGCSTRELMPAASALNMASFNLGFTVGPVLGARGDRLAGLRRGVRRRRASRSPPPTTRSSGCRGCHRRRTARAPGCARSSTGCASCAARPTCG